MLTQKPCPTTANPFADQSLEGFSDIAIHQTAFASEEATTTIYDLAKITIIILIPIEAQLPVCHRS